MHCVVHARLRRAVTHNTTISSFSLITSFRKTSQFEFVWLTSKIINIPRNRT
ncbi:hypothetical protein HanRHA438_Chr01g0020081 [Helianthus annuus]|nr:hypothetical protein HanRHA438_Chr01g0020081 [Helianthus annuus]